MTKLTTPPFEGLHRQDTMGAPVPDWVRAGMEDLFTYQDSLPPEGTRRSIHSRWLRLEKRWGLKVYLRMSERAEQKGVFLTPEALEVITAMSVRKGEPLEDAEAKELPAGREENFFSRITPFQVCTAGILIAIWLLIFI